MLVAAALVAWGLTGSAAPAYRTAVVGTGTVESTLDSVGTVTPVNQASLNFNASGTVSTVDVSVGQAVTAGQTLASLDLATLQAAVTSAQAAVASAQADLASAEASETASSTTTAATVTPTTAAPTTAAPSSDKQQAAKLQAALVAAQAAADTDASEAAAALASATTLCEAAPPSNGVASTTTTSPTTPTTPGSAAVTPAQPGGTGAGPGGTAGTGSGATSAPSTCSEALAQASAAQAKVSADLKKVASAESTLNAALGSSSSGTAGPSAGSTTTTGSSLGSSGSTGSRQTAGTGSGTSKVASPQQLAVDQASIDTAEANLADAQQAVGGANLVSTIAGTVAAVSIAAGDSVTAGSSSSSPQVVVIGTGSNYQVTTAIAVADIAKVAVGQQAVITPDATNTVESGRVSAIGVLATTGTTSTTYPVTITLDSTSLGQLSGAEANVSIVVKKSVGVMTVPSSAVQTIGANHLVTVVDGTTTNAVRVTLGTVGDVLTQVTSGLRQGQAVSLASIQEPLPSTSTTTRAGLGGLGGAGGFAGGGGFGGGFGGGRFGG